MNELLLTGQGAQVRRYVYFTQFHRTRQCYGEIKPCLVWVEMVGPGGGTSPPVRWRGLYEDVGGSG